MSNGKETKILEHMAKSAMYDFHNVEPFTFPNDSWRNEGKQAGHAETLYKTFQYYYMVVNRGYFKEVI